MSSEEVFIPGPAGLLETVVEEPSSSPRKLLGIICHPHPLQEGTMNNKVVTTLVRVLQRLDIVPIRFNFRGIGRSQGSYGHVTGELDDLRAVVAWAKEHYPDYQILLAGFSFGSYIATKVATEMNPVALITIAPPVHHNAFNKLPEITFPWIVVQGEADEVVPPDEVFAWLETRSTQPSIIRLPGVGHFFHGQLIVLRDLLIERLKPLINKIA